MSIRYTIYSFYYNVHMCTIIKLYSMHLATHRIPTFFGPHHCLVQKASIDFTHRTLVEYKLCILYSLDINKCMQNITLNDSTQ